MNRRTFSRLFAGTVTAAGISRVNATESKPPNPAWRDVAGVVPPSGGSDSWEFVILDAVPPHLGEVDGTAVADVDGDGKTEVIIAGDGALLWYRPSTSEKGVIARGMFSLGVALEDIDRDGRKEIVTGKNVSLARPQGDEWVLCWYKCGPNLMEVIVGEHDPSNPYRTKSRLYAYKKADAKGFTGSRYPIDNRFEHYDGAKVVEFSPGRPSIISHGWTDSSYVHIWERGKM